MGRVNSLIFMVGGHAGQGAKTVSEVFSRICSRAGLWVFVNQEYPSNIKGEHNYYQIVAAEERFGSQSRPIDLLLALDVKTVNWHADEIAPGGTLLFDRKSIEVSPVDAGLTMAEIQRADIAIVDMPFLAIAKEAGGDKRTINSVGLGAALGLLRFDFQPLADILAESLAKLSEQVIRSNLEAARRAYEMARDKHSSQMQVSLEKRQAPPRMLLTGNDAMAMGAIKAGMKFYAGYPMTPSSAVLGSVSRLARDFGLVSILPEDEIAAAGMAIGAAHAGVRAMTGTSGGGFRLMAEHYGLAAMAEVPLVIYEGQRAGPATGLPTRTEQGDLRFVLSAHQGEFPRIVIAPGDPAESFYLTFDAFNLAERYQTPVILLSDKHLAESYWTCEPFGTEEMKIDRGLLLDEAGLAAMPEYKRYRLTPSGVSPRTRPGLRGGAFRANGNEHDEDGEAEEDAENRVQQTSKRLRKLDSLDVEAIGATLHGEPQAEVSLVSWGSTKAVILDVMADLKANRGVSCNFLQIIYMAPFPAERVKEVLGKAKRAILIENNATAQLGGLIAEKTGIGIEQKILKFNGRQFLRDELAAEIEKRI